MSDREALVGEHAEELRYLIQGCLTSVGYRASGASTADELARAVYHPGYLSARTALLVLNASWYRHCALALAVAATQRRELELGRLKLVLIHEWGTLGTLEQPQLEHCELIAMLEKPFPLGDLEQIAALELARVA